MGGGVGEEVTIAGPPEVDNWCGIDGDFEVDFFAERDDEDAVEVRGNGWEEDVDVAVVDCDEWASADEESADVEESELEGDTPSTSIALLISLSLLPVSSLPLLPSTSDGHSSSCTTLS